MNLTLLVTLLAATLVSAAPYVPSPSPTSSSAPSFAPTHPCLPQTGMLQHPVKADRRAGSISSVCLAVPEFKEGAPLVITECGKNIDLQTWHWDHYNRGELYLTETPVPPAETNSDDDVCDPYPSQDKLCVALAPEAGEKPSNGTRLRLAQCGAGRSLHLVIALGQVQLEQEGTPGMCVDITDGVIRPGAEVQLWECPDGTYQNENQKWFINSPNPHPSSTPLSSTPVPSRDVRVRETWRRGP